MADLFEYYNTGDDNPHAAYGEIWIAQTFTPSIAHKITSVKLLLYRDGSPGTITVGIRATDGSGHPTGSDLCSGTIDGDTLTTDTAGLWYEITLGAGSNLSADTKYAIVARAPDGGGLDLFNWRADTSSPTYGGGCLEYKLSEIAQWESFTDDDLMFEEWGAAIVAGGAQSVRMNPFGINIIRAGGG